MNVVIGFALNYFIVYASTLLKIIILGYLLTRGRK